MDFNIFYCVDSIPGSLIIASFAVLWAACVFRFVLASQKKWLIFLFFIPFLVPVIAVGYIYASFSGALVRYPFWNYTLYLCLNILRLTPIAVLVLIMTPRVISADSMHCLRLLPNRGFERFLLFAKFILQGIANAYVVAFVVVFLLAFNEFEIASLMSINDHWTVKLFDAHTQGLFLVDSVKLGVIPLALEVCLISLALICLNHQRSGSAPVYRHKGHGVLLKSCSIGYLFVAWSVIVLFPIVTLCIEGLPAIPLIIDDFWMVKEYGTSIFSALIVSVCVFAVSNIFFYSKKVRHLGVWLSVLCVLIIFSGLLGALPLSLLILSIFQQPLLASMSATPVALFLGLAIVVFPYALLLDYVFRPVLFSSSLYCAEKLTDSTRTGNAIYREIWLLRYLPRCWIFFLVFCWAFFDLTVSSILAPRGMATVIPRLYNLMHYEQNEKLSITVLITLIIPAMVFLVILSASWGMLKLKYRKHFIHE